MMQRLTIVPSYIITSYLAGNEIIFPNHISLEIKTFQFPSVLVHDVTAEEF